MSDSAGPPVNELVAALDRWSPNTLEELRRQLPDLHESGHLKPGQTLGEDSTALLRQLAEVAVRSLRAQLAVLDESLPIVRARLSRARRLRLASELCAILGSGSAITLWAADSSIGAVASSVFALCSSCLVAILDFTQRSDDPDTGMQALHVSLMALQIRSNQIAGSLEVRLRHFDDADEWNHEVCDQLVRDANQLAREVATQVSRVPRPVMAGA